MHLTHILYIEYKPLKNASNVLFYTYPLHPEHVHLIQRAAGSQYPLLQPMLLQNESHAASLVGQWYPAMTTLVDTITKSFNVY